MSGRHEPLDLHELAQRIGRLAPSWQRPERFYQRRDDLADALHRIARSSPSRAPGCPVGPSEKERRLVGLARGLAGEVERLRRMLAEAARVRPRRRRQGSDSRQMTLPF
jgi:hypothetical protein